MRPRELTIRGFRSYADEITFEFGDRGLLGVVGPIGSGKSTLLDAIAFALYGQTPTEKAATKSLINQRQESLHVELWFEVGSDTWRSVRALRRKGQSAHALERYEDSERQEIIEGEAAVTAKVGELLGLDFHAFGRSVLLAQNQFDSFLRTGPGERDKVLKGVFGLDRIEVVRELAKDRRDAAARDLEELDRRRAEVEVDRAALVEAAKAKEEAEARATAFDEAATAAAAIAAAEEAAAREGKEAAAVLEGLNDLASRLPSRTETSALLAASLADSDAIDAAVQARGGAMADHRRAEKELETVKAATGDREQLARFEAEIAKLAELEAAVIEAGNKSAEAAKAAESATTADERDREVLMASTEAAAAAEAALNEEAEQRKLAEAALHEARHAEMAAALRSGLAVGDACPVCGHDVSELAPAAPAALAGAEKAADAASTRHAAATKAYRAAQGSLTKASAQAAASAVRLQEAIAAATERSSQAEELAGRLAVASTAVSEQVGSGDPTTLLAERRSALAAAEKAVEAGTRSLVAAEAALTEARQEAAGRTKSMQRLSTELAALGGTLGADISSEPDRDSLGGALERLRQVWETKSAEAEDAVKEAARHLEAAQRDRSALHQDLGLSATEDFATTRLEVQAARAAAAEKVALLEGRAARVATLEEENAASLSTLAVYTRIVDDLAPSKFLAYLLDEERVSLSELAADRFEMLSGGRYRFSEDGSFDIVDLTTADAIRKPRSLSGGETFLASLALALALAEMVSRSGGRLGSFFLDEGFGSLDSEHLDLAMEGIERIVADDPSRLIVIVSHVPELRQRLEDVIELDKHPITGDTVVVRP